MNVIMVLSTPHHMEYDKRYRIDIKEMDMQHERLFLIYNEFVDKYSAKGGMAVGDLEKTFNDMFWYTKYYFREEEWIMRTYNYPGAREHTDQHHHIIDKLTNIFIDSTDEASIVSALAIFIEIWATHILEMDNKYAEFIRTY